MGKKWRGLDVPGGANLAPFGSYGEAWTFARKLEADGLRRPNRANHHLNGLRAGRYIIFRHDGAVWVAWMEAAR